MTNGRRNEPSAEARAHKPGYRTLPPECNVSATYHLKRLHLGRVEDGLHTNCTISRLESRRLANASVKRIALSVAELIGLQPVGT